ALVLLGAHRQPPGLAVPVAELRLPVGVGPVFLDGLVQPPDDPLPDELRRVAHVPEALVLLLEEEAAGLEGGAGQAGAVGDGVEDVGGVREDEAAQQRHGQHAAEPVAAAALVPGGGGGGQGPARRPPPPRRRATGAGRRRGARCRPSPGGRAAGRPRPRPGPAAGPAASRGPSRTGRRPRTRPPSGRPPPARAATGPRPPRCRAPAAPRRATG